MSLANLVGNKCLMMNYFSPVKTHSLLTGGGIPRGPCELRFLAPGDLCLPRDRTGQREQDPVGATKVPNQLVLSCSRGRFPWVRTASFREVCNEGVGSS